MALPDWDSIVTTEKFQTLPMNDRRQVFRGYLAELGKTNAWGNLDNPQDKFTIIRHMEDSAGFGATEAPTTAYQTAKDIAVGTAKGIGETVVGAGEIGAHFATGLVGFGAQAIPGVAGLGSLQRNVLSGNIDDMEEAFMGDPLGATLFAIDTKTDFDKATKTIEKVNEAMLPYIIYEPRTQAGKEAKEVIDKSLEFVIGRGSDAMGEAVRSTATRFAGADIGAGAGTVTKVGTELLAYALLGKGIPILRKKIIEKKPLTVKEVAQVEKQLKLVAGKVQKALGEGQKSFPVTEGVVGPKALPAPIESKILGADGGFVFDIEMPPVVSRQPLSKPKALPEGKIVPIEALPPPARRKALPTPVEPTPTRATTRSLADQSASPEAINRLKTEKSLGIKKVKIDTRSKKETPLFGVDAIDIQPQPFEVIIQRQPGKADVVISSGTKARKYIPKEPASTHPFFDILGNEKGAIDLTGLTDVLKNRKKNKMGLRFTKDLLRKRSGEIWAGWLRSEDFIAQIKKSLSQEEREMIPFIIEGSQKAPNIRVAKVSKEIREYYRDAHSHLAEHFDELGYHENYVNRIWDFSDAMPPNSPGGISTANPFGKARTIPSLIEGMELGMKPRTTDIVDLIRLYDRYRFKSIANKKFVETLKVIKDDDGQPVIQKVKDAPANWGREDNPAFAKEMGLQAGQSVAVHPDWALAVKVVTEKPFSGKAATAIDTVNALSKKALLSVSFFHHIALTESAIASGIGVKALKMWNPAKIYNALKHDRYKIFEDMELSTQALKDGLQLGALGDAQVGRVKSMLLNAENYTKNTPVIGKGAKAVRTANDLWDATLWDYYHNGLKLMAYETILAKQLKGELKKSVKSGEQPKTAKEIGPEVAEFVNDAFGGQNWDAMLVNPKMQQISRWALLAPDWTLSQLKIFSNGFRGGVKGAEGRKYWLRAGLAFTTITQSLNYTLTKHFEGEGKFTWENDPGHELDIYIGRDEDGVKKYIATGKQFREPFRWMTEPIHVLAGKASPVLQSSVEQLTGHTTSGFDLGFEEEGTLKGNIVARMKAFGGKFAPISVRGNNAFFTFPASKGITNWKAVQLFEKAIREQDQEMFKKVQESLIDNGIDPNVALKAVRMKQNLRRNKLMKEQIKKSLR